MSPIPFNVHFAHMIVFMLIAIHSINALRGGWIVLRQPSSMDRCPFSPLFFLLNPLAAENRTTDTVLPMKILTSIRYDVEF